MRDLHERVGAQAHVILLTTPDLCADQIETSTSPPPPPPGNYRAFDHFLYPGSGEFDLQGFPGGGDLTFAWVWWEKLNRKCQVLFFFSGAEVANVFRRDGIN